MFVTFVYSAIRAFDVSSIILFVYFFFFSSSIILGRGFSQTAEHGNRAPERVSFVLVPFVKFRFIG